MPDDYVPAPLFSSALPITVLTRPSADVDWLELDQGPGYFHVPQGHEVRVRIKSIGDSELIELVQELRDVEELRFLDLSENRNVTNEGLKHLRHLPQLTGLNLSSCSITTTGLDHLLNLPYLSHLNLSYCNKLTEAAMKKLESMKRLSYVDLTGVLNIGTAAMARVRRRDLTINR